MGTSYNDADAYGVKTGYGVSIATLSGTVAATAGGNASAYAIFSGGPILIGTAADPLSGITGTVRATAPGGDAYAIYSADSEVDDFIAIAGSGCIIGNVDLRLGDDRMLIRDDADLSAIPVLDGGEDYGGVDYTDTLTFAGWSGQLAGSVIDWEEIEVSEGSTVDLPEAKTEAEMFTLAFDALTIDGTSTLLADGDSPGFYTLTGDITNSGTISLLDDLDVEDRLTITGNYTGDDGTIALDVNTAAGTADRVAITGDVDGTTTIDLNEIGTPTTPTSPIALITVDGTVAEGAFTAGEYTYGPRVGTFTLSVDESGGVSTFSLGDFTVGFSDESALMQGVSSFVERLGFESLTGFRERHAYGELQQGADSDPASLWVRAYGSTFRLGQDGGETATSMKGYSTGTQFGADLSAGRTGDAGRYHAGLFAGTAYQKADVHGITDEKAGEISQQVYTMGLYGSIGRPGCYWVEGVMQAGYHDLDITSLDEPGTLNEEIWSMAASLEAGVSVPVSRRITLEPQAQVIYLHQGGMELGTEMGDLAIREHNGLRTRLGTTGTLKTERLPFNPFVEASLQHDFSGKAKVVFADTDEVLQSEAERTQLGGAIGIASKSSSADSLDYYVKAGAIYGMGGEGSYDYTLTAGLRKAF